MGVRRNNKKLVGGNRKMTNVQFEEQKAMISLVMAMAVTERLTREGLLEKAENAPTVEEKLEVMKELSLIHI